MMIATTRGTSLLSLFGLTLGSGYLSQQAFVLSARQPTTHHHNIDDFDQSSFSQRLRLLDNPSSPRTHDVTTRISGGFTGAHHQCPSPSPSYSTSVRSFFSSMGGNNRPNNIDLKMAISSQDLVRHAVSAAQASAASRKSNRHGRIQSRPYGAKRMGENKSSRRRPTYEDDSGSRLDPELKAVNFGSSEVDDFNFPSSDLRYTRQKLPRIINNKGVIRRDRRGRLHLSSSLSIKQSANRSAGLNTVAQNLSYVIRKKVVDSTSKVDLQDFAIFSIYACCMVANTMTVVLLPMIAADPVLSSSSVAAPQVTGPAFVGAIISLSSIFAACGKFVNGFVCQSIGGRASARLYFVGLAAFALFLSMTSSLHGLAIGGMEFCASIMWTACTVLVANRYQKDPKKFAATLTCLSLGSTAGTLIAKTAGSALLCSMHWRSAAKVSASLAMIGAIIAHFFVTDDAQRRKEREVVVGGGLTSSNKSESNRLLGLRGIYKSIQDVLGNRMFWVVGLAHACAFLARSSDKLLGTFFQEMTQLPREICGSLTSSVTIGFVAGLVSGRKMNLLESQDEKTKFISNRYKKAVASALGLALCANSSFGDLVGGKVLALGIALASGMMAASVSFQFYQIPAKFGTTFGDNKAVCISFLDGMGFLVGAPIWSGLSKIVASSHVGAHGWSLAWVMIAGWLALGGGLMTKAMPTIMRSDSKTNK